MNHHLLGLFVLLLTTSLAVRSWAQQPVDSLQNVTIVGGSPALERGWQQLVLDSARLATWEHQSLGQAVQQLPHVFVQSFGTGGVQLPLVRGTGPGHTQVLWQGFSLNSPLSGQVDLSSLSGSHADQLRMAFGPATLQQVSGAFGATLSLEHRPSWQQPSPLYASIEGGSFDTYAALLRGEAVVTERLHNATVASWRHSQNDFPYTNTYAAGDPEERFSGAAYQFFNLQNHTTWRPTQRDQVHLALWGQQNERQLGSSMLVPAGRSALAEANYRMVANYERAGPAGQWTQVSLAHFVQQQDYSSTVFRPSETDLHNSQLRVEQRWAQRAGLESFLGYLGQHSRVRGSTLAQVQDDWRHELFAGAELTQGEWGATATVRGMLTHRGIENGAAGFSLGRQLASQPWGQLHAQASVQRNYRLPTVAELSVEPWANPDLRTEEGLTAELGLVWQGATGLLQLNGFLNDLSNRIVWQPRGLTLFQPVNVPDSRQAGLSLQAAASQPMISLGAQELIVDLSGHLSYSRSSLGADRSLQVIFLPQWQGYGEAKLQWGPQSLTTELHYASQRYIDPENEFYLPAYWLVNLWVERSWQATVGTFYLSAHVDNLMGYHYQVVPFYPMAGRAFRIKAAMKL